MKICIISVDRISVLFTFCSSIMIHQNENNSGKTVTLCCFDIQLPKSLKLFVETRPSGMKLYLSIFMSHFLSCIIMLCIYVPFGFILRYYFFDDYYKPQMLWPLINTLAYTGIGIFVSMIFSFAYFKVKIK